MSYENKTQEFNDRVKEILGLSDIEKLKKIAKGNYGLEAVYATFRLIELNRPFHWCPTVENKYPRKL